MPAILSVPSNSNKRQRVVQHMPWMMPQMPQMMPQQMWGMVAPPTQPQHMSQPMPEEEEEEDESAAPHTAASVKDERRARPEPGMDNVPGSDRISRSVTFLKTVPRQRLSEGLEWVRKDLDATVTHSLSSEGLLAVLYMLTRLKPSCRITDLRFWD